jgi:hypothetical protein
MKFPIRYTDRTLQACTRPLHRHDTRPYKTLSAPILGGADLKTPSRPVLGVWPPSTDPRSRAGCTIMEAKKHVSSTNICADWGEVYSQPDLIKCCLTDTSEQRAGEEEANMTTKISNDLHD